MYLFIFGVVSNEGVEHCHFIDSSGTDVGDVTVGPNDRFKQPKILMFETEDFDTPLDTVRFAENTIIASPNM